MFWLKRDILGFSIESFVKNWVFVITKSFFFHGNKGFRLFYSGKYIIELSCKKVSQIFNLPYYNQFFGGGNLIKRKREHFPYYFRDVWTHEKLIQWNAEIRSSFGFQTSFWAFKPNDDDSEAVYSHSPSGWAWFYSSGVWISDSSCCLQFELNSSPWSLN